MKCKSCNWYIPDSLGWEYGKCGYNAPPFPGVSFSEWCRHHEQRRNLWPSEIQEMSKWSEARRAAFRYTLASQQLGPPSPKAAFENAKIISEKYAAELEARLAQQVSDRGGGGQSSHTDDQEYP